MGLWQAGSSSDPQGSLYSLYFTADSLEGVEVTGHEMSWGCGERSFCSLGPVRPSHAVWIIADNLASFRRARAARFKRSGSVHEGRVLTVWSSPHAPLPCLARSAAASCSPGGCSGT